MASSAPAVARSIAEVTRESIRVEKLRGRVQTVFPIHACMTPTANNSETQDYGTVGSDGPIEGATKVFQVTLRDLSLPGNSGTNGNLHHRIDAYFYDKWADDHHSGIGPGDDIEVSGPSARLVHPDPSASDNGDHPFCLVFHTGRDDSLLALGAVAADHLAGVAGGSGGRSDEADDVVSCKVVRKAAQPGAGSRGGAAPTGRGGGGGRAKASYAYTTLESIRVQEEKTNVYGVVCSFTHRHQSRGRDMTNSVSLLDESCPQSDGAVPCNFFSSTLKGLPAPLMVGDIVRLHRAKVQEYRGRPQLLAAGGAAWLVIRKKKAMRETYQKCPIGGISSASGDGDGGVDDEDPDPDDDSPPSGPDAGGGEADAVLPATDWEVQSSSANYTLSQVDQDRCIALSDWLATKSPHLWLKSSSEVKVWVQDIFRRPQSGDVISKLEVDLVCCLTSKHEKAEGGAGSLSEVYVADGTGFASSMPGKEWDDRRDAALLKGVRTALGKPGWSPGNPRPPPIPAHLKVEVTENKREWEALALSPGMWVRLRRLTIVKNRATGNMSAKMIDKGSSVNPLHPSMVEVQHIAMSYATHCASASSSSSTSGSEGRTGSGGETNTGGSTGSGARKAPSPVCPPPRSAPAPATATAGICSRQMPPPRGNGAVSGNGGSMEPPIPASLGKGLSTNGDPGVSSSSAAASGPSSGCDNRGRATSSSRVTGCERRSPPSSLTAAAAAGAAPRKVPTSSAQQPAPLLRRQHPGPPFRPAGSRGKRPFFDRGGASKDVLGTSNARMGVGGEGAEVGGHISARGTKRALPLSEDRTETRSGAERRPEAPEGKRMSNLEVVRSTAAPNVFDTRARIVSHWPTKVEDFVRHGPEPDNNRLHFLFTLRLEDDYGVVDAIASGPDASLLLPGSPSPAEFYTSLEVRSRVERVLTRLESTSTGKARGGVVELRLRSYLAPLVEIRHRGDKCKRYSIIAPSCLEDQG
ncbi:unnamed protein product [Ectocarpus sp. 6 AP-2014]